MQSIISIIGTRLKYTKAEVALVKEFEKAVSEALDIGSLNNLQIPKIGVFGYKQSSIYWEIRHLFKDVIDRFKKEKGIDEDKFVEVFKRIFIDSEVFFRLSTEEIYNIISYTTWVHAKKVLAYRGVDLDDPLTFNNIFGVEKMAFLYNLRCEEFLEAPMKPDGKTFMTVKDIDWQIMTLGITDELMACFNCFTNDSVELTNVYKRIRSYQVAIGQGRNMGSVLQKVYQQDYAKIKKELEPDYIINVLKDEEDNMESQVE